MFISDKDKLFFSKLDDAVALCSKRQKPYFFSFLSEERQRLAIDYLNGIRFTEYGLFGGYEEAERKILGLFCDDTPRDYPVSALEFTFRKLDKLTHRDFLGALMSLGIERETVGDILVENGRCVVFVKSEIKDYVISQISKIGNTGVKVGECPTENLPSGRGTEESVYTVTSLRFDNVVAAITGLSREKTKSLILSGNASLNHNPGCGVARQVGQGDVVTVRGKGKYIIGDVLGETKKHRLRISVIHFR